ncbi:50S ribosomal protein L21e [Patescibacteria group bacterium]|nr:50S ribosomal protein L21e [Patescibacteria group bacterium]
MVQKKKPKSKKKLSLGKYFQKIEVGESVAVVREPSLKASFPKRMQGRTGIVEGKRGKSCVLNIKDYNKEKRFIIEPIHLKKIKNINPKQE